MQQFYSVLKKNILFANFENNQLDSLLPCLKAYSKSFSKNDIIREQEELVTEIGIIVKGVVYLSKTDAHGNRRILYELSDGKCFGEAISFVDDLASPVSVVAETPATVIFISSKKILDSNSCGYHNQLTENMIKLLSEKNTMLQIKNDILSQKTTREKLLLYFDYESKSAGSKSFKIHFSREELADFLSLNPSAMSRELGNMRDDGILSFHKNRFKLKMES